MDSPPRHEHLYYLYVLQSIVYIIIADDDTSPGPSKRQKLSTTNPEPISELAQLDKLNSLVVCVHGCDRKFEDKSISHLLHFCHVV